MLFYPIFYFQSKLSSINLNLHPIKHLTIQHLDDSLLLSVLNLTKAKFLLHLVLLSVGIKQSKTTPAIPKMWTISPKPHSWIFLTNREKLSPPLNHHSLKILKVRLLRFGSVQEARLAVDWWSNQRAMLSFVCAPTSYLSWQLTNNLIKEQWFLINGCSTNSRPKVSLRLITKQISCNSLFLCFYLFFFSF